MARFPGASVLLAALLCAGLPWSGSAQGGWRQWDVYLRNGTRLEANPLGAPDPAHVSLSMAGFERREDVIPRARIDLIAAQTTVGPRREPIPGAALPPRPPILVCQDLVVRRDGRRTLGEVTLVEVAFSEGVIRQRGVDIDLREVAFIKFTHPAHSGCTCRRQSRS